MEAAGLRVTERLPRETGRDYALRILKDNIVSLELTPGSFISENEVSAELGLSRTPVREAFIELSKVRIIETYPQKKSMVSLIDYDLLEESRFMRNVLELAVAELDCAMAVPEDIARLEENIRLQNYYLESFFSEKLMALDHEFHRLLFAIAKKPQVFEQICNFSIHFDRVRSIALTSVKNTRIIGDHENIVLAIAQKDARKARSLMDAHLNRYKIDASAIRERYPDYFK